MEHLTADLGFSPSDIQEAKQSNFIHLLARRIDFPDAIKKKVDNPRARLFSTLKRVLDSTPGHECLHIEPDEGQGYIVKTSDAEFLRAFSNIVADIATRQETSRTLNTNKNIRDYFDKNPHSVAKKKNERFTAGDALANPAHIPSPPLTLRGATRKNIYVLPKSFKVRLGNQRVCAIHEELTKLEKSKFTNSGVVLLRVFLEISMKDFLDRIGRLGNMRAQQKNPGEWRPRMSELVEEILPIVNDHIDRPDRDGVIKLLTGDSSAMFSMQDLHSFVHNKEIPTERDIDQFWSRLEPLFKIMLQKEWEEK